MTSVSSWNAKRRHGHTHKDTKNANNANHTQCMQLDSQGYPVIDLNTPAPTSPQNHDKNSSNILRMTKQQTIVDSSAGAGALVGAGPEPGISSLGSDIGTCATLTTWVGPLLTKTSSDIESGMPPPLICHQQSSEIETDAETDADTETMATGNVVVVVVKTKKQEKDNNEEKEAKHNTGPKIVQVATTSRENHNHMSESEASTQGKIYEI